MINDHFLFKEGDKYLDAAGLNRDWPDARGIFCNSAKTFLIWVNEEDQFRVISMQPGGDIKAVFTRLSKAHATIEKVAKFA
jgi:arginine kinase